MAENKKKAGTVVTAPLVAIKTDDGRRIYLYRGADVGQGYDQKDVARLQEMNLVGDQTEDVVPGVAVSNV